jgi:diguanylate cyclase (GGDEF)-like protein/PAS domain S-box-containing protein
VAQWARLLLQPQGLGAFAFSLVVWAVVFFAPGLSVPTRIGLLGMMLLPAIWSVFHLDLWLALAHLAVAFILVLGATLAGYGPYAALPTDEAVIGVELLGIAMSAGILFAGALQRERLTALAELRVLNNELEQRAAERAQALLRRERSFRDVIDNLPAPALLTAVDTSEVLYANSAASELFGDEQASLVGRQGAAHWVDPSARDALLADLRAHHAVRNREFAFRRFGGGVVWVLCSVIQTPFDGKNALLFVFKDITERKQREQQLATEAQTDALTGLPNRRHFQARAQRDIGELAQTGQPAACVMFDLDDFKQINDSRGHACGDLVLQQAASALHALTPEGQLLARLGGEEFCLFLRGASGEQALQIAEAMRRDLEGRTQDCPGGERIALPTCSIGVACTVPRPEQAAEAVLSALMEQADIALYQAKADGKNRSVLYQIGSNALPASRTAQDSAAPPLLPLSLLRALVREVHFGRFFERIAAAAAQLLGADGAAFIERDGDMLGYRLFYGLPESYQRQFSGYRFPADLGVAGRALREGRAVFEPDYAHAADALPAFVDGGLKASYAVPVRSGTQTLAVLALAWFSRPPDGAPQAQQAQTVELLADLMAGALRRERLERRLRLRATHDALTRLPNRTAVDLHLGRAIARARRQHSLLAVGMLDLDDFKPVNDQWGHEAGDALLQAFAQRLQQALRDTDFVGRIGGDEFVLVLEGLTDTADLDTTLTRLHAIVEAPFALPGGQRATVDMSLGIALYPQHGADADSLLRAADAALYAGKSRKASRTTWWQLPDAGQQPAAEPVYDDGAVALYGDTAQRLLQALQPHAAEVAQTFVTSFYAHLAQLPQAQAVLDTLDAAELDALKQKQLAHLLQILQPDLDKATHRRRAQAIGSVHALTGVSTAALVDAMEIYLQQAQTLVTQSPLRAAERATLHRILAGRVRQELQAQTEAEQEVKNRWAQWIESSSRALPRFVNRIDFMQWILAELTRLPGVAAAAFGRPDADGRIKVEFSTPRFDAYLASFQRHRQAFVPTVDDTQRLAQASQVRAWRNERIETVTSFARDDRAQPWRGAALEAGFRSAVTVPIRDTEDRMAAILTLYGAYPNQFESEWVQHQLTLLGQVFTRAHGALRQAPAIVLSGQERRDMRARLTSRGLEMVYQPVLHLREGRLARVEALARLRRDDGGWIFPAEFLPGFGVSEITRLFILGMEQALEQLRAWDAQGLQTSASINLPPEVLLQTDSPQWIAQALARAQLPAQRLHLELLESSEFHEPQAPDAAVRALSALGLRLEMDDLGSGYSSLLRLRNLPFHTVKIDQGLVREAEKEPRRVIGFIGSLIRLAHTLELDVVVEGLESAGLVEIATILGADQGQGYALSPPLRADELAEFVSQPVQRVDPAQPQTVLGALAAHWLWEYGERDAQVSDPAQAHRSCALGHYLQTHGLDQGEIGQIHARLHALAREQGIHNAAYREQTARMIALLMQTAAPTA